MANEEIKDVELKDEELDEVAGGFGLNNKYAAKSIKAVASVKGVKGVKGLCEVKGAQSNTKRSIKNNDATK